MMNGPLADWHQPVLCNEGIEISSISLQMSICIRFMTLKGLLNLE